jgi:hypothetical protein
LGRPVGARPGLRRWSTSLRRARDSRRQREYGIPLGGSACVLRCAGSRVRAARPSRPAHLPQLQATERLQPARVRRCRGEVRPERRLLVSYRRALLRA